MKKILVGLMIMAVCGGAMAQSSVVNTSALNGTVDMFVNVWNNGADTNCDAWEQRPLKLEAYLAFCFDEVFCPQCPIDITDAVLVLVDKKAGEVWYDEDLVDGENDMEMFCLGGDSLLVGLSLEMMDNYPWMVMLGKRKDTLVKNSTFLTTTEVKSLKGAFGEQDVDTTYQSDRQIPVWTCDFESIAEAGTVTFSKMSLKVPANSCLTCGSNCSDFMGAFWAMIDKKYPGSKYDYIDTDEESYWDWWW